MVIDTHVHVFPPEIIEGWEKIAEHEPYFSTLVRGSAHRWATVEDLLASMDENGVSESWICGFGFNDLGLCRVCNEYVADAAIASKGRLRWLCVVPPMVRGAEKEITRCAAAGAIGVGEIFPDGQDWGMEDVRETWRFAGACHEHNMYMLLHVAEYGGPSYPGKGKVGAREMYSFAINHPESLIVAAHWGGGLFLCESMKNARDDIRNVWYDTAAAPFVYDSAVFEAAFKLAPSKILYGSDFPLLTLPRYQRMLNDTDLSSEDVDRLFFRNARELLSTTYCDS